MNIVTKTAFSNFRRNKSRNILIGVAILLTAVLLTAVPTVFFGTFQLENEAVKAVYPTYHAMFRNVGKETADRLMKDEAIEEAGLREDPAYMIAPEDDVTVGMIYADEVTCRENRMVLEEGRLPEKSDEIVVSGDLLKAMGMAGDIGSRITVPFQVAEQDGLSLAREQEFTIVGFLPENQQAKGSGRYTAMVSQAFADDIIEEGHEYRVYIRLRDVENRTTDEIEKMIEDLGTTYGIQETDVVSNTDMLNATYKDPAAYGGFAVFMVVTALAGVLTIYSIYYVSMLDKVQEYGKLRAIGATRKQIRSLVFREGFAVAAIAVPVGIILGVGIGILILKGMVNSGIAEENMLAEEMRSIIKGGMGTLVQPWILLLGTAVSFLTVYLSLLRPMKVASRISAIEAIRYQGEDRKKKQKKERKGYHELSVWKLTLSNLGRNRKRTVVTICTLGVTGIFFITVATLLGCMSAKSMTQDEIRSDVCIEIESWVGDKMHPEREIWNIQKANPLTEELKEQIRSIDGVEKIEETRHVAAFIQNVEELKEDDGSDFYTGIDGLPEEVIKSCKKYVKKGSLEDPKLSDGTGIILGEGYITVYTDLTVGDGIDVAIRDGDKTIEKTFEIVAVVDAPNSLLGNSLTMPTDVLQGFCDTDLTDSLDIYLNRDKEKEAKEQIRALAEDEEFLEITDYAQVYETMERSIGMVRYMGYGALSIFGLIGILNLVNTMINSVHVRRKELGMLQAIGMSDRQLIRMLQLEGLFYTAGTLVLSVGAGSIGGYVLFLRAKADGMFSIRFYEYPAVSVIVLAAVVLAVQLLITWLVNWNFKKQSLIDRVRFS